MFWKRFSSHLSLLVLTLFVSGAPLLASANCLSDLTGFRIGVPSAAERARILQDVKASLPNGVSVPGDYVSAVTDYLVQRTDLTGKEKAKSWNAFMKEIVPYVSPFPIFNRRFLGRDGSIVFQGHLGRTIVFTKDGKVFRGNIPALSTFQVWKADYSGLTERKLK